MTTPATVRVNHPENFRFERKSKYYARLQKEFKNQVSLLMRRDLMKEMPERHLPDL